MNLQVRRALLGGAMVVNAALVCLGAVLASDLEARGDFVAFYTAGTMVRSGEGSALYDFDAQARVQQVIAPRPRLLPFLNPPPVALLLAPLSRLDLRTAGVVWRLANLALLVWLWRRLGRDGTPAQAHLVRLAVLAAPAMLITFTLGAFSLLVMSLLLLWHDALGRGQRRAGVWLALGLVKPQLVALPILAMLAARRWRLLGVTAAVAGALAIAATAAFGVAIWPSYARALVAVHRHFDDLGIRPTQMYNLEGTLLFAFPSARAAAPVIAVVGFVTAAIATLAIWRGPWRPAEPRFDLQIAATVLVGAFFSLHLYPQDGLMIVTAALLFDSYLRRSGRPRAGFAALALTAPLVWFVTEVGLRPRLIHYPALVAIALGAMMARELRASPAPAGEVAKKQLG